MSSYAVGQKVRLSNNPAIIFEIINLNPDHTYQIQFKCSEEKAIKLDNISVEMLRLAEESPQR